MTAKERGEKNLIKNLFIQSFVILCEDHVTISHSYQITGLCISCISKYLVQLRVCLIIDGLLTTESMKRLIFLTVGRFTVCDLNNLSSL